MSAAAHHYDKLFREYSIAEVQQWMQLVQNGKFASSAAAIEDLDGSDVCTLTEEQMKKRCPKRGDVLFNLIASLNNASTSASQGPLLSHHQHTAAVVGIPSPSRDSSRHSSPVNSEPLELSSSSSDHTPVQPPVYLFPAISSEFESPPAAMSGDPFVTSGFLRAPLPPQAGQPHHSRRESNGESHSPHREFRDESRLSMWTHPLPAAEATMSSSYQPVVPVHHLHSSHSLQQQVGQQPSHTHAHHHHHASHFQQQHQAQSQFQSQHGHTATMQPPVQLTSFVAHHPHRREPSSHRSAGNRAAQQENPQVMVFIPRHWKASRTSAEINDKLTELFFGVGNGMTIKSAPFSVHDFRVISFTGGWRDLFLRDRVLLDNGAGEDPALIFKCFGGYIKFKLYRA